MEEIQNNPNIPDDIKAVLSGSVLDDDVEDSSEALQEDAVEAIIQEKLDDILNEDSDEEMIRSRRGRKSRKKKDDDDWFATKKERMDREKLINGPRPRGRPKRKSDEGTEDKAKRKKQTPKKKDESTRKSSTDSSKTQSKLTKKPPPLPFNLMDFSKKFEGKIPNIKNHSTQGNDLETVKNEVEPVYPTVSSYKLKPEILAPSYGSLDRLSQPGRSLNSPQTTVSCSNSNTSLKTTSMQNGVNSPRTTISSTISSKDVKPCEIILSKYSVKV